MTTCTLASTSPRACSLRKQGSLQSSRQFINLPRRFDLPAKANANKTVTQRAGILPKRSIAHSSRQLSLPRRYRVQVLAYAQTGVAAQPGSAGPTVRSYDFLVLGSGIAGLSYALKVAQYGSVAVVTKEEAMEGCTQYAQGGVCAVLAELDTFEDHIHDTMVAGDFVNCKEAVEAVCREGPAEVLKLAEMGAKFTRSRDGSLHLTREGGHSARRIVHADDVTGREIERALMASATAHKNITFYEHHLATELVWDEVSGVRHCLGADVLDQRALSMTRFVAPVTMLATGGAGQVYPNTTNPSVATGDGMAMAARAAAKLSNLEFVQFHPTGFHSRKANALGRTFLISEAVRGEGGLLYNKAGYRFMNDYDARLELAPRDIVARAIHDQMLTRGDEHVLLDISHCQREHVLTHFPNIAAQCAQHGVDITTEPIPVAPAAHYMCGGVQTGLLGETTVAGLFAAGEVACSGLHGANRLASNSLLEGLVFANRAVESSVSHAEYTLRNAGRALHHAAVHADFSGAKAPAVLPVKTAEWVAAKRAEVQQTMWASAGIVRRVNDMTGALQRLTLMGFEAEAMQQSFGTCTEIMELRNLVTVGTSILQAALLRKESRGGHFCLDYPPRRVLSPAADLSYNTAPNTAPNTARRVGPSVQNNVKRMGKRIKDQNLGGASVRGKSPPRSLDIVFRSLKEEKSG